MKQKRKLALMMFQEKNQGFKSGDLEGNEIGSPLPI
jgi:hypothetical protein